MTSGTNPIRHSAILIMAGSAALAGCKTPDLSMKRETLAPVVVAPLRQQPEAIPVDGKVTVREGDNLYSIAARYRVPPTSIIRDNQLGPPYMVVPGQLLTLSPRRTHTVGPEDSVHTISQRYAVSQYQLAEANALDTPL